jgi:hypothetical protein
MVAYGGHLPRYSSTAPTVETDIQPPPFPTPEVPTTDTLTPQSQNEQPVQYVQVDNESDLESNSGSESGSISAHESRVDTDVEVSRVKSGGRRKLQRKRPTLIAQYQGEFPTMYTAKPAVPPCHSDGRRGLDPPGSPQHPRLNTGRATLRPPVVTKGPACLGETCEGGILSQNGMNLS